MRIGFIGAGTMAGALAVAIAAAREDVRFCAHDVNPDQLARFAADVPRVEPRAGNSHVAASSDVVFLAVKPQGMETVLAELAEAETLVVSIAAGVRLARLEAAMPRARVVRVMPNTPALVGEMAAGYSAGARALPADLDLVESLLLSAGVAYPVPEELLDTVTGLSGSGPAFVARIMEAFTDAAIAEGLPAEIATGLVLATFSGTARLLRQKGLTPDELVRMVSSKGGTTVAGRRVLETSGLRGIIRQTVATAVARSRELGQ